MKDCNTVSTIASKHVIQLMTNAFIVEAAL